jgi:2-keto-4-pentenoate hydratase/2-oxohepta-3-ene-1,7-dioic acid hydratase in catechol pathway
VAPNRLIGDCCDLFAIAAQRLFARGRNWNSGHLKEMGLAPAKWASMPFFLRPPTTTLVGPGKKVRVPKTTRQFDWECELAVVAGKRLQNASREQAAQAIAGYAIGLDMTCRDLIQVDSDLKVDLVRGKRKTPWRLAVRISFLPNLFLTFTFFDSSCS